MIDADFSIKRLEQKLSEKFFFLYSDQLKLRNLNRNLRIFEKPPQIK